jgi:hypothetical protein
MKLILVVLRRLQCVAPLLKNRMAANIRMAAPPTCTMQETPVVGLADRDRNLSLSHNFRTQTMSTGLIGGRVGLAFENSQFAVPFPEP